MLINAGLIASEQTVTPIAEIPDDFRGIPFSTWLDIFLEYALCLARKGETDEAYSLCEAAKDAIVFYHSREDMFLIHVCWCGRYNILI
jgi:general transcription factor 3C polypeptide 3 (transcription factor C subunit 4)